MRYLTNDEIDVVSGGDLSGTASSNGDWSVTASATWAEVGAFFSAIGDAIGSFFSWVGDLFS